MCDHLVATHAKIDVRRRHGHALLGAYAPGCLRPTQTATPPGIARTRKERSMISFVHLRGSVLLTMAAALAACSSLETSGAAPPTPERVAQSGAPLTWGEQAKVL